MATLAGQQAGVALAAAAGGGPVGIAIAGAIGAAIGNYADNKYLIPALFPEDDVAGPKFDSIELSYASEGAPMNRVFGSRIKVTGAVIWISVLREVFVEEEVAKGGFLNPTIERSQFRVDLAIVFSDTGHLPGQAVDGWEQIFFDGNLVWQEGVARTVNGSDITIQAINVGSPTGVVMILSSPPGGTDFAASGLQSGLDATVAGSSNGNNNGTFRIIGGPNELSSGRQEVWFANPNAVGVAAGDSITITQTGNSFDPDLANSFAFHDGDQTTADVTIAAAETDVPAWKECAYVVVNNLNLDTFGGKPPTVFEAVMRPQPAPVSRSTVVKQLMEIGGRVEGTDFDVSGITGDLRGYVQRGPTSPSQSIATLMIAFDILVQDRNGVYYFFDHVSATKIAIDPSLYSAHERGSDSSDRNVKHLDKRFRDLAKFVSVTYIDKDNDLQKGTQDYGNLQASTEKRLTPRFDIVLSAEEAQCIARRMLWTARANATGLEVQLPPSQMKAIESDVLQITTDDGVQRDMRATLVDVGENGVRAYQGVEDHDETLNFTTSECVVEPPAGFDPQTIYTAPELSLQILDIAALTDSQTTEPGLYWVVSPFDPSAVFVGAALFESKDGGTNFVYASSAFSAGKHGFTQTALGAPADVGLVDLVNTFTVKMFRGVPSSSTLSEVLSGANRWLVGDEIVGVVTWTDNGDDTYTASTLLRGLRDTEDEVGTHVAAERAIYLNAAGGVNWALRNLLAFNSVRDYKAVAAGGVIASFNTQVENFPIKLNTLRPFHPGNVSGTRNGSNDLTIAWERRTRAIYNSLSANPVPQLEPTLLYEVDILDQPNPGATVLRTISATTETATYLATEQTADGLTPGNPVDVEIFQLSSSVGRSKPKAATI